MDVKGRGGESGREGERHRRKGDENGEGVEMGWEGAAIGVI